MQTDYKSLKDFCSLFAEREKMAKAKIPFPRGFLWGTATAAHQVEGQNTNNNWHAWEEAGKTADKSGLACDWWGGRW